MLGRHKHHRNMAIGQAIGDRTRKTNQLTILHSNGDALRLGDELGKASFVAKAILPAVGRKKAAGGFDLGAPKLTHAHGGEEKSAQLSAARPAARQSWNCRSPGSRR